MKTFPILYHKGSKGVIYSWEVWADKGVMYTRYGQLKGEKVDTSKEAKPKNVGRSNATTAEEQAEKEAEALWQHKLDRKYSKTIPEDDSQLYLPMLAKNYKDRVKKIDFSGGVDVQRKLDGLRCLAKNVGGKVILTSRQGIEYNQVPHINEALLPQLPEGRVLDGELYLHGVSLQTINSWVKKNRPETSQLEYHIYDMPIIDNIDDYQWLTRRTYLELSFFSIPATSPIKKVQTFISLTDSEVRKRHDEFVGEGYEGAIIRLHGGVYKWGFRSEDLLKLKDFDTDEYKVIGFREGEGTHKGCVVWICETKQGKQFEVNPKATLEQKKEYFQTAKEYIGKYLTVKYIGFTDAGIPKYANGLAFRLDEDLPNKGE